MEQGKLARLSGRERQILDVIYAQKQATAAEVQAALPDAPSYSTVRTLLSILEKKGYLQHESDGARFLYRPTVPRDAAGPTMLQRVMTTFFGGSVEETVASLLDHADGLSPEACDRLAEKIAQARREGR